MVRTLLVDRSYSGRPDVHLADEDGHRAVGVHGQERVDRVRCQRLAEEAVGAPGTV
jgi:hypothetical protein